jgi:hypothetical protein
MCRIGYRLGVSVIPTLDLGDIIQDLREKTLFLYAELTRMIVTCKARLDTNEAM